MVKKSIAIIVFILFVSSNIQAKEKYSRFILNSSILPIVDQKSGGNDHFILMSQLKAMYAFKIKKSSLALGLSYENEQLDLLGDNEETRRGAGITASLILNHIVLTGIYFPYHRYENENSVYSQGMGARFDFGYFFKVSQSMSVGPQLSLRYLYYSKRRLKQAIADKNDQEHFSFIPMFSAKINF